MFGPPTPSLFARHDRDGELLRDMGQARTWAGSASSKLVDIAIGEDEH